MTAAALDSAAACCTTRSDTYAGDVRRLLDLVLPTRMGRSFRWLVTSSWTSNLGDGIGLAAGPLLIASQTRDPLLVALAALL
jgi:hypothetical protein